LAAAILDAHVFDRVHSRVRLCCLLVADEDAGSRRCAQVADESRVYVVAYGLSLDENKTLMGYNERAVLPLIVKANHQGFDTKSGFEIHRYYFWFFGFVAKPPYERELPASPPEQVPATPQSLTIDASSGAT